MFCLLLQKNKTFSRFFTFWQKNVAFFPLFAKERKVLYVLFRSFENNRKECSVLLGLISRQNSKKERERTKHSLQERERTECSERKRTRCPTLTSVGRENGRRDPEGDDSGPPQHCVLWNGPGGAKWRPHGQRWRPKVGPIKWSRTIFKCLFSLLVIMSICICNNRIDFQGF